MVSALPLVFAVLEDDRLCTVLETATLKQPYGTTDHPGTVSDAATSRWRRGAWAGEIEHPDTVLEDVAWPGPGPLPRERCERRSGRRAVCSAGTGLGCRPLGRHARVERGVQRAEAVSRGIVTSCCFVPYQCDTLVAVRVESPRVQLVNALDGNAPACNSHSHNSPACSLHGLHDARCVVNSKNSVCEVFARGRGVCVLGERKALSTSTLCQVWGSAVGELAPLQQASGMLHEEASAGCKGSLRLKISPKVKIQP